MNKTIITMLSIIVITLGIVVAVSIIKPKDEVKVQNVASVEQNENDNSNVETTNINNSIATTTATEEKTSPNAFVTFITVYGKCGHTTSQYREIPEEMVNLSKEELQEKYSDWKIEKFTDTDIIMSQEVDESCNEHFVLRDKDGTVTVFKKLDNGEEEEYEITDIATEYLTDTDKINIEKGLEVNGVQELNQLIEDFE